MSSKSNFEEKKTIRKSFDAHVKYLNSIKEFNDKILIDYSIYLAQLNVVCKDNFKVDGGPFGAVVFDPKNKEVISVGVNQVVLNKDPTCHAEIVAARNALKERGSLEGLEIYTSCECCPMCLSFLLAQGVDKIYYSASREDAASVGFSDEKQYEMLEQDYEELMQKTETKSVIGCNIIVDNRSKSFISGEETISTFALREYCSCNSEFHVPENTIFEMEFKPHPFSFFALDWARVGRVRNEEHPNDPAMDLKQKDKNKIIYSKPEFEKFGLDNIQEIFDSIKFGSDKIIKIGSENSYKPFELWNEFLKKSEEESAQRY